MGEHYKDITGQKFGMLTAVEKVDFVGKREAYWKCLCDCGNETIVSGHSLRRKDGGIKSCGCSRRKKLNEMIGKKIWKINGYLF